MVPTVEQVITAVINRELHAAERGQPWTAVHARQRDADRGGWTKAGITATTLGEWRKLGRPATRSELEMMGEAECREIYWARYIKPFGFSADPLRAQLCDWAVTSGLDDPIRALQTTLRARGIYRGAIDGVCGAQTRRAALNDPDPRATYRDVLAARVRFYVHLSLKDPDVVRFMESHPSTQLLNVAGWVNRALEFAL